MGKRLALMQPYFFPYIGYYTIMKHVDYYVYFDTAQYIKGGWINRNRILKPNGTEWQYITIPIKKHHASTPIKDVSIDCDSLSIKRIVNQLTHYKRIAPYYNIVTEILNEVLSKNTNISELNRHADKLIRDYLGIQTIVYTLSENEIDYKGANSADEWGLNVCKAFVDVDEYWNAPGGVSFFDVSKYSSQGIKICFIETNLQPYSQKVRGSFVPGLSILDVMMFNSPEEIKEMLNQFEIIESNQAEIRRGGYLYRLIKLSFNYAVDFYGKKMAA